MTKPEDATRPPAVGTPLVGRVVPLRALAAYLQTEADFNRRWANQTGVDAATDRYVARRLELAAEREAWIAELDRVQDVLTRCVRGIDHLDKLTREWEPDHSSGADRHGWVLAKDARDDAAAVLRHNVRAEPPP